MKREIFVKIRFLILVGNSGGNVLIGLSWE